MKISIFGANGVIGRNLTKIALMNGYEVTVYLRPSAEHLLDHPQLTILYGEIDDHDSIDRVVHGADVVIHIFGPKVAASRFLVSEETENIIGSMKKNGIARLIVTSTSYSIDKKDRFDIRFTLARWLSRILITDLYFDILNSIEQIRLSQLDWTIVRIPMLSDNEIVAKSFTGYIGDGKIRLSRVNRNEVAAFLYSQIKDSTFLKASPILST